MLGSAVVGAQFIAGKAARDALFLTHFDASSLPNMIIMTSIFSIVLVAVSSKGLERVSPATWVPAAFAASAILLIAEWGLTSTAPGLAARILYLQISGLGPMLGSGFWLIASECFDPHTAKKRFGQIAGAGTLGGLLGGLIGDRVSAMLDIGALLPLLAALSLGCAWQIRRLARSSKGTPRPFASPSTDAAPKPARSGLRVLADAPYLRTLAAIVMLGTVAAGLVDQSFKTQVKAAFGGGPSLGTFFSRYYAALSLVTFLVQAGGSRLALERFGLAAAAGTPALTFLLGGTATLLVPGLRSIVLTRWSEAVVRGSIFRAGYELFYTAIAPKDKRAVKSIVDVGVDRTGDIVGAGLNNQILSMAQPGQTTVQLSIAVGCSAVALLIARRLKRGYMKALEKSLLSRAVELDLSDIEDLTTRTTMLRTMRLSHFGAPAGAGRREEAAPPGTPAPGAPAATDSEIQQILTLQSRDRAGILRVLHNDKGLTAALVPHVIPLLAWDQVGRDCVHALRKVAEERVGELTDALVDPNQPFAVRRRLARVFSVCVSQRAVDGLLLGLEDLRFEVRFQCARSLLAIVEKNPAVRLDKARVFAFVNNEVAVNKEVWENRRLLDGVEESDSQSFLEALVKDRASQALAHVFTLLALVLPTEPLRIAFRGLHTDDQGLRGTALEYLECVLPADIRERLWPFLEDRRPPRAAARPRDEALADLLRSHQSITLNLEELKKRAGAARKSAI